MGKQGGGGGGPAPFLVKTHDMVEDAGTDEVISWEEKGRSFVVWKPVEFARDLLPAHFKHNNFSSFVRQLNTYGFRKVVPDRWEFGNEYFRRGEQRLLSEIRRRKSVSTSPNPSALKSTGSGRRPTLSTSNSGDVQSTSSASSPPPPPPWPVTPQLLELSHENEKLKKDNESLSHELAQAKQQYEELVGFLSKYVDIKNLDMELLMQEAALMGDKIDKIREEEEMKEVDDEDGDENTEVSLKLFGVLLKEIRGEKGRMVKRKWCEGDGGGSLPIKMGGLGAPWMGISTSFQGSSKVCN